MSKQSGWSFKSGDVVIAKASKSQLERSPMKKHHVLEPNRREFLSDYQGPLQGHSSHWMFALLACAFGQAVWCSIMFSDFVKAVIVRFICYRLLCPYQLLPTRQAFSFSSVSLNYEAF